MFLIILSLLLNIASIQVNAETQNHHCPNLLLKTLNSAIEAQEILSYTSESQGSLRVFTSDNGEYLHIVTYNSSGKIIKNLVMGTAGEEAHSQALIHPESNQLLVSFTTERSHVQVERFRILTLDSLELTKQFDVSFSENKNSGDRQLLSSSEGLELIFAPYSSALRAKDAKNFNARLEFSADGQSLLFYDSSNQLVKVIKL